MTRLFFVTMIVFLPQFHATGEEAALTPESFIEQLQGDWEIVARYNAGNEWKPADGKRKPTMKVEGKKIFLPEGIGKLPYDLESLSVQDKVIQLTLVRRLGGRTTRREALAQLKDAQFTLTIDKFRGRRPATIKPGKTNLVQVWKRLDSTSK